MQKYPTVFAAVLLAVGSAQTCALAESATNQRQYARPNSMVDIGGRSLNMFCLGTGAPTVIFESGATLAGWDWMQVHSAIARATRACIYDRAGLGFSDASTGQSTSATAVADLRKLIAASSLPPPFVLVGHSYGAMNVQLFAYKYPELVGALVLIDSHHEDEAARIDRASNGRLAKVLAEFSEGYSRCSAAAESGLPAGSPQYASCMSSPPPWFGRELYAAYVAQMVSSKYWKAAASEYLNLYGQSSAQMRMNRRSFGDLPIASLTRSISPYGAPGKPLSPTAQRVEAENRKMQDEIARLSSSGSNRVVANAGHSIHIDQPQEVISTVLQMVGRVRP